MLGLQDNEAVVNSQEFPIRNGVGNIQEFVQSGHGGMQNGHMAENDGGLGMKGALKSSVTSKFNNDLIHSEKDSNGKALVNSTQNY